MSEEKPWLKLYPNEIPSTLDYPEQPVQEFLVNAANEFPEKKPFTLWVKSLRIVMSMNLR